MTGERYYCAENVDNMCTNPLLHSSSHIRNAIRPTKFCNISAWQRIHKVPGQIEFYQSYVIRRFSGSWKYADRWLIISWLWFYQISKRAFWKPFAKLFSIHFTMSDPKAAKAAAKALRQSNNEWSNKYFAIAMGGIMVLFAIHHWAEVMEIRIFPRQKSPLTHNIR